ncbi:uncharacterized protein B0T23DRAFT_358407 [Neurospora hispaniola]|uniref:Dynamin N-terminal domain-containing protein n=1 Tax=Neurospora hispaniola TaxID=588809 RepID=A0AAJ0MRH7_9PEZI|nr:hypothetical protein B0T23DRAFT_358407 [Neurospora hispaniola]
MSLADTVDPIRSIDALDVLPLPTRMRMLEDCLDAGLKYSSEIAKLIGQAVPGTDDIDEDGTDTEALGRANLKQWLKDADEINDEHKQFEILVGVQGKTGAGKTSLLNALLGYKDLLPPNDALVATAAICQVAYNYSNDPKKAFRAEITFRKLLDVKHELNQFFQDIKLRDQLLNGRGEFEEDDGDRDSSDDNDIGEITERINATAEKIGPVWGYTRIELESKSTQDLLAKTDPAVKLLSTTKTINAADLETFAPAVKPYLDATTTEITGRAGAETREMAVWPLIDHVKVYVKSEVLRGGIVLVDLPGLGEIVETRAAVARKFYNKLTVSIVVTPSVRAAGEKTAVNLMTENQEINMRMSGKLDDRGYCVVLSKADDGVDWQTTARNQKRQKDIKMVSDLTKKLNGEEAALNQLRPQIAKVCNSLQLNAKISGEEKRKRLAELRKLYDKKKIHLKLQKELTWEKKRAHWGQVFTAVQSRSALLATEINRYLKERHAVFMKSCPGAAAPFCPPKIFPISVRAYWPLQRKIEVDPDAIPEDPMVGFPEEAYTGIPALKGWLYEATIPQRERHMKALLHRLIGLYYNLQTWSDKECERIKLHMTPDELREEYLDGEYKLLEKVISDCNPLKDTSEAMDTCIKQCVNQVKNWIYKDPEGENPHKKLHYGTFLAIIKAGGGVFFSRAGGQKKMYDWMEGLAHLFKNQICSQWVHSLHEQLPLLEGSALVELDARWDHRINTILTVLKKQFPRQKDYLTSKVPSLKIIKEQVKDQVAQALHDVAINSDDVHKELAVDIKAKWKTTFKRASDPKLKGKGTMEKRHKILRTFSTHKDNKTYKDAVAKLKKEVAEEINKFPKRLETIWMIGLAKLKAEVSLIMDNIVEYEKEQVDDSMEGLEGDGSGIDEAGVSEELRKQKIGLQEKIRPMLNRWYFAWDMSPGDVPMHDVEELDQDEGAKTGCKEESKIPTTFSLGALANDGDNTMAEDSNDAIIEFHLNTGLVEDSTKIKEEIIDSD